MTPKTITALIAAHVEAGKSEQDQWDRWHSWYVGEFWEETDRRAEAENYSNDRETEEINLETNYPFAFIDTMIANICPTNPQVTINPLDPDLSDIAKARERLANDCLRRDKTHAKAWDISSIAGICGWGVSKTVWRKSQKRSKTILIDPRNFYWDRTQPFDEAAYAIEATPIKAHIFKKRSEPNKEGVTQYDPKVAERAAKGQYPEYLVAHGERHRGVDHISRVARNVFEWVLVYEVYDFENGKYYHMLPNIAEPLYEGELPYEFFANPYDLVVFNNNLRDSSGISDIKLIRSAQERLNEIDSLELNHAHSTIPTAVVNPAWFEDPEAFVSAIASVDGPGAVVQAELKQNDIPLEAVLQFTQSPSMSPSFDKMRDRSVGTIEFVLALPAYSRGSIGGADVATEVALADSSTRTRNGRRIKVLEDWIKSVAEKHIALTAQFRTPGKEQDDDTSFIAVRGSVSREAELLSRADLGFDSAETFADEMLEYLTVPYSPTENHRLVQLQKLQTFMELLVQHPNIDQQSLANKLLELLGMGELFQKTPPQPPGGPQAPGAPPGQGPLPNPGEDPIEAGGLPEGQGDMVQAQLPPGAMAMASQPKLEI